MVVMTLVAVFFSLSVLANIGLVFYIKKLMKAPGEKTYDVKEFMQDLLNGAGIVKVERIDPTDILLRSPRHRQ